MTVTAQRLIGNILRRHQRLAVATLLVLLMSNLLNVLLPLSVGIFYEIAFQKSSVKGALLHGVLPGFQSTSTFFVFFGGLVLLKGVLHFFEKYWTGRLGEYFSAHLREEAFKAQIRQTTAAHVRKPSGRYLLRFSGDLNAIRELVNRGVLVFTGDVFFLLGAFVGLSLVNWQLALLVAGVWVAATGLVFGLSRRLRVATLDRRGQRAASLAFVSERLQAFYTVKSFNRETPEIARYQQESQHLMQLGWRFFRWSAFLQALSPVFFFGMLGLVLWYSLRLEITDASRGSLFAFVLLLLHMHTVLQRMLEVNLVWQSGATSLGKLLAVLNQPLEERSRGTLSAEGLVGKIEFQQVAFTYPKTQRGLRPFNAVFEPNALSVLKGASGVGKTTVFRLLQKMYTPTAGEIWLDGQPLSAISPFEIRREVAIVSADAPLLGKTVFAAISYGRSPEHRADAAKMLERLHCSFGESSDATLDFRLWELGNNLSAGQKALLQVARALLTNKKIVLLDEPFVHLDTQQTNRVVRMLNRLKTKHTIILIARRVPTRLEVDHTITFDEHETEPSAEPDTTADH